MTLENINQQTKDLLYNLLNNGDSYITGCDNYSITYQIDKKIVSITVRRCNSENKEYKLHVPKGDCFMHWSIINPAFDKIEDPICFEVCIGTRCYYYHPEDRVQEATLLDLMEQKAANYLYNNLVSVNNILTQNSEEF